MTVPVVVTVVVPVVVSVAMSVIVPMVVSVTVVVAVTMGMSMFVVVAVAVGMSVVMSMIMFMVVAMAVFTTQVIVSLSRVQNLHLNQVEAKSDARNCEHLGTYYHWWNKEPLRCLDKEPDSHHPDRGYGNHSPYDLGASPPVSQVVRRAPLSKPKGND